MPTVASTLAVLLLLAGNSTAYGQTPERDPNIRGGVVTVFNFSTLRGNDLSGTIDGVGLGVGVFGSLRLHPRFAVQAELLYTQKGDAFHGSRAFPSPIPVVFDYIEAPVSAKIIWPAGTIEPSVYFGSYVAYLVATDSPADLNLRKFDAGAFAGAGLGVDAGSGRFAIAVRYSRSFFNVFEAEIVTGSPGSPERVDINIQVISVIAAYTF